MVFRKKWQLLRVSTVAERLGVSRRWVEYAMQPPEDRPEGRLRGIPILPTQRNVLGARCVLAADFETWRQAVRTVLIERGFGEEDFA